MSLQCLESRLIKVGRGGVSSRWLIARCGPPGRDAVVFSSILSQSCNIVIKFPLNICHTQHEKPWDLQGR